MKKIDRRIIVIAGFIFIIVIAFGLMRYLISLKGEPPRRPTVETKRFVKTQEVKYDVIISPVVARGRVSSISEIDIVAEASGKIIAGKVPLKKGSGFSSGDLLFTIYPDEVILALKARKSQFLNQLANLLPDINIDYPTQSQIFSDFFSSIDIDKDLPEFPNIDDGKIKVFLASRNVLSEYYSIIKDELKLNRHSIYAPFDGTFKEVNLEAGAYTNAGGKVAHAIRTDELELEVPVPRFDAEWIKIGDQVTIESDERSISWSGRVIRKNQFVDEDTQSQGVFVKIQNLKNNPILSGEYFNASFSGHPIDNSMEIPSNVVFNHNEVFIVAEGRLQRRIIDIIKRNDHTVIFKGLEEGDILVNQPLINVQEGTHATYDGDPNATKQQDSPDGASNADRRPGQKGNN